MTIPTLFASVTAATGQQLDDNFEFVGILGAQSCTIAGTNALTFTPAATSVGVTAYQSGLVVSGIAVSNNTAATTARVGGLAPLPVYYNGAAGPVALTGGEIQNGNLVFLVYNATLNAWVLLSVGGSPALDTIGSVQGDILYRGASGWVVLAPGTAGQVLGTGGAAANPSWKNFSIGATAGATSAISVTASPFTYTAGNQYETVYITGGTVSVVAVNGTTVFSASPCTVRLAPGKAVVVTYSVLPTMNKTVD